MCNNISFYHQCFLFNRDSFLEILDHYPRNVSTILQNYFFVILIILLFNFFENALMIFLKKYLYSSKYIIQSIVFFFLFSDSKSKTITSMASLN